MESQKMSLDNPILFWYYNSAPRGTNKKWLLARIKNPTRTNAYATYNK